VGWEDEMSKVYDITKKAVGARRNELRTIYKAIGQEIDEGFRKNKVPLIDPSEDGKGHTDSGEWTLAATMATSLVCPFMDIMWWGIGEVDYVKATEDEQ
jgi:hypothetical protein